MSKIFRKETLTILLTAASLVLVAAAVELMLSLAFAGTLFFCFTLLCVAYMISTDTSPAYKLGVCVPMLIFPLYSWAYFLLLFPFAKKRKSVFRTAPIPEEAEPVRRFLCSCGFACFPCENTRLYPWGSELFYSLLESIRSSESFVYLEFFIYSQGRALDMLLRELELCAGRGVEVRVMADAAGSAFTKPSGFEKRLAAAGIKLKFFHPLSLSGISRANYRDHRKIAVIDGKYAFFGGINIADEYFGFIRRFGVWKDGGAMVSGAAAAAFSDMFLSLWEDSAVPQSIQSSVSPTEAPLAQPFSDSPLDSVNVGLQVFLSLLSCARHSICISTPYLACDDEIIGALCCAAGRGVDVRLYLPHIPDKKYVNIITKSFYEKLLSFGIRIFEFEKGFIHSKNMLCDDKYAVISTVNLDYRSLSQHYECGCVFYGGDICKELRADLDGLERDCISIPLADARKTGIFVKIARVFLKLLMPLM